MAGMAMLAGEVPESASCSATRQRGDHDRQPGSQEAAGEQAPAAPAGQPAHGVVSHVGHRHADDAHVEDVGAQRQQPAILEDQRLDADHAGHHQDGRPGAEQDGGQGRAHQVPGGAAGDGEVEHLPGEDGRCQHAHQRHLALAQVRADPAQGVADDDHADGPSEQMETKTERKPSGMCMGWGE